MDFGRRVGVSPIKELVTGRLESMLLPWTRECVDEFKLYSDLALDMVVTGEPTSSMDLMSKQEASMLLVFLNWELILTLSSSKWGLLGFEYKSSSCQTDICWKRGDSEG